ncbi:MAG TPA: hypothetical protein VM680_01020 [Verrucomicrobiae bacterium]|nr:hypothetical protein [Verrucomicrobiae bacterium]
MNVEAFKNEVLAIRARHRCPAEACREVFEYIQTVLHGLSGEPVTGEFKRALREELDRAFRGLQGALKA